MNKTLKKAVSLLLALMMIFSIPLTGAFAADEADTTTEEVGEHPFMFEIFIDFWVEVFEFFRYIFYDVWLGVPA